MQIEATEVERLERENQNIILDSRRKEESNLDRKKQYRIIQWIRLDFRDGLSMKDLGKAVGTENRRQACYRTF